MSNLANVNRGVPRLKIGTDWVALEIQSEPHVALVWSGYLPAVYVLDTSSQQIFEFYITSKSLAEGVEPLRQANGGRFTGLRFRIKKESRAQFTPYVVEQSSSKTADGAGGEGEASRKKVIRKVRAD